MRRPSRAVRLKAADDVITNDADMSAVQQPGRGLARPLSRARGAAAHLSERTGDTEPPYTPFTGGARLKHNTADDGSAPARAVPADYGGPGADTLVFEQPLNERMRTFLRLDFLYNQALHHNETASPWGSRAAMAA